MKRALMIVSGVAILGFIGSNIVLIKQVSSIAKTSNDTAMQVQQLQNDVTKLHHDVKLLEREVILYKSREQISLDNKQFKCLAKNIFFEAGVEDKAGKIAVAEITWNRLKEGKYGDSVCEVVYQHAQFSWTLFKAKRHEKPKGKYWEESIEAAHSFLQGNRIKGIEKSTFYHTTYIKKPKWANDMKLAHHIGQHLFYDEV